MTTDFESAAPTGPQPKSRPRPMLVLEVEPSWPCREGTSAPPVRPHPKSGSAGGDPTSHQVDGSARGAPAANLRGPPGPTVNGVNVLPLRAAEISDRRGRFEPPWHLVGGARLGALAGRSSRVPPRAAWAIA